MDDYQRNSIIELIKRRINLAILAMLLSILLASSVSGFLIGQDPKPIDLEIVDSKGILLSYNVDAKSTLSSTEVNMNNAPIDSIELKSLNISRGKRLGVDSVSTSKVKERKFSKVFAIDPMDVDFETAVVTITPTGRELYKCVDWNFVAQTCYGEWVLFKTDLIPGQQYTFTITAEDPGFGEVNITDAIHLDENRTFISNIYNETREQDNNWSEAVYHNEYVRVTFAENLTNGNVIEMYTRNNLRINTSIEIYEENGSVLLGFTPVIIPTQNYLVRISNLANDTNVFDLRIVNAQNNTSAYLEFDYLHDAEPLSYFNGTFFEDWETGSFVTNNWSATAEWQVSATNPLGGSIYSAESDGNGIVHILNTTLSTVGYDNITFSFWYASDNIEAGEYCAADWYNGTSWFNVMYNETDTSSVYQFVSYTLPPDANNNPDFRIRFRALASSNGEECFIDNITVTGDNLPPFVDIICPLGQTFDENYVIPIIVNVTDIDGVDSIIANVTLPNTTVRQLFNLSEELPDDDFENDTENVNWMLRNISGSDDYCYGDINGTVPGKMFIELDANGTFPDLHCAFIAKKKIVEDFDVNITFNVTSMDNDTFFTFRSSPTEILYAVGIRVYLSLIQDSTGNRIYKAAYFNGTATTKTDIPTTDTYGKFRIRRFNSTELTPIYNLYYWNNTGLNWENVHGNISLPSSCQSQTLHIKPGASGATYGHLNMTLDDFFIENGNNTFFLFNETAAEGRYNITIIANDTEGNVNDTETTYFNITRINDPPSRPFIDEPDPGDTVQGLFNITWGTVFDEEGDNLKFNITLLNPDLSYNATIITNYGNASSTIYEWNSTQYMDGEYNLRVTVYENETAEGYYTPDVLTGSFYIDNTPCPRGSLDYGDGTVNNPCLIETCHHLNDTRSNTTLYYALNNSIDCNVSPYNTSIGWNPIDDFSGSLEGNHYNITGLYIRRRLGPYARGNVGLFGNRCGSISNLHLIDVDIHGGDVVGGLTGRTWTSCTITNSSVSGYVLGTDNIGLIAGINDDTIQSSHSSGLAEGMWAIGGLVGQDAGSISDSYSTADVDGTGYAGGLIGTASASGSPITNNYATGNVSASNQYAGGLVGNTWKGITNCFSIGNVTGTNSGGLVGILNAGTITSSYWYNQTGTLDCTGTAGNPSGCTSILDGWFFLEHNNPPMESWDFQAVGNGTWERIEGDSPGYPILIWEGNGIGMLGSGTQADPYNVTTCSQLQDMEENLLANYSLSNLINCTYSDIWNWHSTHSSHFGFDPVGYIDDTWITIPFEGEFNGRNHTIHDLYINWTYNDSEPDNYEIGLFGSSEGAIHNVGLINVDIYGSGDVGSLVGVSDSFIYEVFATGKVYSLWGSTGGLVAYLGYGTILNSYTMVDVTSTDTGAGGLVGSQYQQSHINDSYATGSVTASDDVGGLVGFSANISNCFSTGDVSGTGSDIGGLVGVTSAWGQNDITDSYYYNSSGNPPDCIGRIQGVGATECTGIPDLWYFYWHNDPPMEEWDFGLLGEDTWDRVESTSKYTYQETADSYSYRNDVPIGGLYMLRLELNYTMPESVTEAIWITKHGVLSAYNSTIPSDCFDYANQSGTLRLRMESYSNAPITSSYGVCWNGSTWILATVNNTASFSGGGSNPGNPATLVDGNWSTHVGADYFSPSWRLYTSGSYLYARVYEEAIYWRSIGADYPALKWENRGSGMQTGSLLVTSCSQLQDMREDLTEDYLITNLINCTYTYLWNGGLGFEPVSNISSQFSGSLNGQNYYITDLFIDRPAEQNIGIIGYTTSGSSPFDNITIVDATIVGNRTVGTLGGAIQYSPVTNCHAININVTGITSQSIGGLIGSFSFSNLTDSTSSGIMDGGGSGADIGGLIGYSRNNMIYNCSSSVNVTGNNNVGGLVGYQSFTTLIDSCYTTGTINGNGQVGGLSGYNLNYIINNSYSTSNVNGNYAIGGLVGSNRNPQFRVFNSYATGNVTGGSTTGGLAGYNEGNITSSYSTGSVSGTSIVGGLVGSNNGTGYIKYSNSSAIVSCSNVYCGGITGRNGYVYRVYFNGSVTSTSSDTGGISGAITTVRESVAEAVVIGSSIGSFTGGIVGMGGIIYDSYFNGTVIGGIKAGGISGGSSNIYVNNSYAIGSVSSTSETGGLVGYLPAGRYIIDSFADNNVSASVAFEGGLVGFSQGTINNSYWNNKTGNPSECYDSGDTGCIAIQDNSSYFQSDVYPYIEPFDVWQFHNIWCEVNQSYPQLTWISDICQILDDIPPVIVWNWTDVNSTIYTQLTYPCIEVIEEESNMSSCTLDFNGTFYYHADDGSTYICWNVPPLASGNYTTIQASCTDLSNNTGYTTIAWLNVNVTFIPTRMLYDCPAFASPNETFRIWVDYEYAINETDVLDANVSVSNASYIDYLTYSLPDSYYYEDYTSPIEFDWIINITAWKPDHQPQYAQCTIHITGMYNLTIYLWQEKVFKTYAETEEYIVTEKNYDKQLDTPYINDFAYILVTNKDVNITDPHAYCNIPIGSAQEAIDFVNMGNWMGQDLKDLITEYTGNAIDCDRYWFSAPYTNGEAVVELPYAGNHSIYLLDGTLNYIEEYAPPQVIKSNLFLPLGSMEIPNEIDYTLDYYVTHDELDAWSAITSDYFVIFVIIIPFLIAGLLIYAGVSLKYTLIVAIGWILIWLFQRML